MPAVSHKVELHTKRYFVSVTITKDGRFCSGSKQPGLDFSFWMFLLNMIGPQLRPAFWNKNVEDRAGDSLHDFKRAKWLDVHN
jgi:hypothetical protein